MSDSAHIVVVEGKLVVSDAESGLEAEKKVREALDVDEHWSVRFDSEKVQQIE